MSKKEKRMATLMAIFLIVLAVTMLFWPREAQATETYEGGGETYTEESEEEEKEVSSKDGEELLETKDEVLGELSGAVDDIRNSALDAFSTEDFDRAKEDYEAPAFVTKIERKTNDLTVLSSDILARAWIAFSALAILHGILGVSFTVYYDYFSKKKFSFFFKSVTTTRDKYLNGGTTTTTTTGADGVSKTITETAKKVTGPFAMYVSLFFSVIVEVAITVCVFLLIKNGIHMMLIKVFLTLFLGVVEKFLGMLSGI